MLNGSIAEAAKVEWAVKDVGSCRMIAGDESVIGG